MYEFTCTIHVIIHNTCDQLNPSRSACVHTSKITKVFCICDSIIVQSIKVTTHRAFVYMRNWECAINIITNITHMYM